MTSLAEQLQKLSQAGTDQFNGTDKAASSFLFPADRAAELDTTVICGLGRNGIETMVEVDSIFGDYVNLFGAASMDTNRELMTEADNVLLDQQIEHLLQCLSAYLLQPAAHNVLEWLVRRYRVHVYNAMMLLECFLPYHNTKVFARMLQLINIKSLPAHWNFLLNLQKAGAPLSREALVARCARDASLLRAVLGLIIRTANVTQRLPHGVHSQTSLLCASIATGTIDLVPAVSEQFTQQMLAAVIPALQLTTSTAHAFQAAALLVVSHLLARAVLRRSAVENLMQLAVKHTIAECPDLCIRLCVVACQYQRLESIPLEVVSALRELPNAAEDLGKAAAQSSQFQLCLLSGLLSLEADELFADLSAAFGLQSNRLGRSICKVALKHFLDSDKPASKSFKLCLRALENRCGEVLDATLSEFAKKQQSPEKLQQFSALLADTVSRLVVPDAELSLALSLQHAESSIRILAIQKLEEVARAGDRDQAQFQDLEAIIIQRLHDSDPDVSVSMLKAPSALAACVEPQKLSNCVGDILLQSLQSNRPQSAVVSCALSVLLASEGTLPLQAEIALLGAVFLAPSSKNKIAKLVLRSLSTSNVQSYVLSAVDWSSVVSSEELKDLPTSLPAANSLIISNISSAFLQELESNSKQFGDFIEQTFSKLNLRGTAASCLVAALLKLVEVAEADSQISAMNIFLRSLRYCPVAKTSDITMYPSSRELVQAIASSTTDNTLASTMMSALSMAITMLGPDFQALESELTWTTPAPSGPLSCLLFEIFTIVSSLGRYAYDLVDIPLKALMAVLPFGALLRYLSLIWSKPTLDLWTRAHALRLASTVLQATPSADFADLDAECQELCPYILTALTSRSAALRVAAVDCLRGLTYLLGQAGASNRPKLPHLSAATNENLGTFLTNLLSQGAELAADASHLSEFLAIKFHSLKLNRSDEDVLNYLSTAALASPDTAMRVRAWRSLSGIDHPLHLLRAVTDAKDLLEQLQDATYEKLHEDEQALLRALLSSMTLQTLKSLRKVKPKSVANDCYHGLVVALRTGLSDLTARATLQDWLLQHVLSPPAFDALPEEYQAEVFHLLCVIERFRSDEHVGSLTYELLNAVKIPVDFLAEEIRAVITPDGSEPESPVRDSKRRRKSKGKSQATDCPSVELLNNAALVVDLVLRKPSSSIQDLPLLIPTLFDLLRFSLEPSNDQVAVEHTKQTIISALTEILVKSASDDDIAENVLDIELLVQCVRGSTSPQTHYHTMLLLAELATKYPERVLHSIMPVFTFMGKNLVSQDNSFSLRTIERTVSTIVPALLGAKDGYQSVITVVGVFVDAFNHIPAHRRAPMFEHLVVTLGASGYLHLVTSLLLKKHVLFENPRESQSSSLPQFCQDLFQCFPMPCQVSALSLLMRMLHALPNAPHSGQKVPIETQLLFAVDQYSSRQCQRFKFQVAAFVADYLSSDGFLQAVVKVERSASKEDAKGVRDMFVTFLEEVLIVVTAFRRNGEEISTSKYGQSYLGKLFMSVERANAILGTVAFTDVVRQILAGDDNAVRERAILMLSDRITTASSHAKRDVKAILSLVGVLESYLDPEQSQASVSVTQAAIYALNVMLDNFAEKNDKSFSETCKALTGLLKTKPQAEVRSSALVCLATCCIHLETKILPQMPEFMPEVLEALRESLPQLEDGNMFTFPTGDSNFTLLQQSAIAATSAVIEKLANFIGPFLKTILPLLTHPCLWNDPTKQVPAIVTKFTSCRVLVAECVPIRLLFPACFSLYATLAKKADKSRLMSLNFLFGILQKAVQRMSMDDVKAQLKSCFKLCLAALSYSVDIYDTVEHWAEVVEEATVNLLMALTMRLSETSFKPLYLKLVDWATNPSATMGHQRLFFYVVNRLAGQLKPLFVPYFANILQVCVTLLKKEAEEYASEKAQLVLSTQTLVVEALAKCFMYDESRFTSKDRFHGVLEPLLKQLNFFTSLESEDEYVHRAQKQVIPCITHLAVAVAEEKCWHILNKQVLLHGQSEHAVVRLASAFACQHLYQTLGEEYLGLLPETIPTLAELMEDDDLRVEKQCQATIKTIESFLGESLQTYLQ